MNRIFAFLILLSLYSTCEAIVRYNPVTGFWEGNICSNLNGWTYVNFQPVGSFCQFMLPNGMIVQGQIINQ